MYLLLSACQCYWQAQPAAELPLRCCGSVRAAVPVRACASTALGSGHHVQCHCRRHAEQTLQWQLPAGCHLDLYPMHHGWLACQRVAASYAAGLYWEAGVFAVAAVDVCLPALDGHLLSPLHPHHPGAAQQCSAAVSASCSSRCCQIAPPPHSALHLPSACALAAADLRSHQPHCLTAATFSRGRGKCSFSCVFAACPGQGSCSRRACTPFAGWTSAPGCCGSCEAGLD